MGVWWGSRNSLTVAMGTSGHIICWLRFEHNGSQINVSTTSEHIYDSQGLLGGEGGGGEASPPPPPTHPLTGCAQETRLLTIHEHTEHPCVPMGNY